jgi:membrane-anchored protein YejM (alkaline phosphatase superfamily)
MNPPGDDNIYHACTFDHIQDCDASTQSCSVIEQPIRWENVTARHLKATLDMMDRAQQKGKPWLINHAFTQVHQPWVPSRHFVTGYPYAPGLKPWTSVVGEVDWAIGVFLEKLKNMGVDNNTVVIVTRFHLPSFLIYIFFF